MTAVPERKKLQRTNTLPNMKGTPKSKKSDVDIPKQKKFKKRFPNKKKNIDPNSLNTAQLTKANSNMKKASMSLDTTSIQCDFCPEAFNSMSLGIISMLCARIDNINDSLYGFYIAFQNNNFANITGTQLTIKSNLNYISELFNGLRPKSIRTSFGEFKYTWTGFTFPGAIPKMITVRNASFFFYKPVGADSIAVPQPCAPMNIATTDEAYQDYSTLLDLLTEKKIMLTAQDYTMVKNFEKDVSCFSASSVYVGAGSCDSGGVYTSGENELPCAAIPLLSQFCTFRSPSTRVSSFLRNGAGDACMAFTMPFIKDFKNSYYRSAHNVRIKFIDFAEVYETMVAWVAEIYTKARASNFYDYSTVAQIPIAAFIGGLRQTILQYFFASQAATQFLTWDNTGQFFEPFRMGCNCAPKVGQGMLMPMALVEQIRYLRSTIFEKKTELRHNDKNAIIYLPCWGINRASNSWTNPQWQNQSVPTFVFADDGFQSTINWCDGQNSNGTVFNLNSSYFLGAITTHNQRIASGTTVAGLIGYLEGSPPCSTLPFTRLYNLTDSSNMDNLNNYPEWMDLPPGFRRKKVVRTMSGKKEKKEEYIFQVERVDAGGSSELYNQVPDRINSLNPLSDELINVFRYIILPSIINTNEGLLTSQNLDKNKLMVMYKERNYITLQSSNNVLTVPQSQGTILKNNGLIMASGVADQNATEYARVIDYMNSVGTGGFLSEILGLASGVAGAFGV